MAASRRWTPVCRQLTLLVSWLMKQLTQFVAAMYHGVVWSGGRETVCLQFHALGYSAELRLRQQHEAVCHSVPQGYLHDVMGLTSRGRLPVVQLLSGAWCTDC